MFKWLARLAPLVASGGTTAVALACIVGIAQPAEGAGEHKPLPPGTKLSYDNFGCTIQTPTGFSDVCGTMTLFGQLVLYGKIPQEGFQGALRQRDSLYIKTISLSQDAKAALQGLWPLTVGKSVAYDFDADFAFNRGGWQGQSMTSKATVHTTIAVTGEASVDAAGETQKVLVIVATTAPFQVPYLTGENAIEWTWWLNPDTGVVVKARTAWTKGPNLGLSRVSTLMHIDWPAGYKPQEKVATAPAQPAQSATNTQGAAATTTAPAQQAARQTHPATAPASQSQQAASAAPTPESLEPKLSGAQRKAMQQQLALLGFYGRAASGTFGPSTRDAIKKFQRAHDLPSTGYLDAEQIDLLNEAADAKQKEVAAATTQQAEEQTAAKKLADEKAAQEKAEADRKAAEDQARKLAAQLEEDRKALEAQKAELQRQQEELAQNQQTQQQEELAKAEADRKAAEDQTQKLTAQLEADHKALEAQKAELQRQQEELAKSQQQAASPTTPETPPAPAATETAQTKPSTQQQATASPMPEATPSTQTAPAGDFSAVLATLQPIDEVYVATKPAKIRSAPNVAASRVGTLNEGDKIQVLGRLPGQDWFLVARDDQPIGYVVANQLASQADATRATPGAAATTGQPTATAQGGQPNTQQAALPPELASLDYGSYHAIVIGNDMYRSLPRLNTAVSDAEAVAKELERDYHFSVHLLTNASEEDIIGTLTDMRRELNWDDNLLIYYAGHGWYDQDAEQGYWLPVDASEDNQAHWISNADITNGLKALKAKHILVVADSCYSGTLARNASISVRGVEYIERIVKKKARTVLTSGGLEPVLDAGGEGHSVFAHAFLEALAENDGVIDGQELFRRLRDPVVANAPQTPEYGEIRGAGHDGGDFIFVRR